MNFSLRVNKHIAIATVSPMPVTHFDQFCPLTVQSNKPSADKGLQLTCFQRKKSGEHVKVVGVMSDTNQANRQKKSVMSEHFT